MDKVRLDRALERSEEISYMVGRTKFCWSSPHWYVVVALSFGLVTGCSSPGQAARPLRSDLQSEYEYLYEVIPRDYLSVQLASMFTENGYCVIKYEWKRDFAESWLGELVGDEIVPIRKLTDKAFLERGGDFLVESEDDVDVFFAVDTFELHHAKYSKVTGKWRHSRLVNAAVDSNRQNRYVEQGRNMVLPGRSGSVLVENSSLSNQCVVMSTDPSQKVQWSLPWPCNRVGIVDGNILLVERGDASESANSWYSIEIEEFLREGGEAPPKNLKIMLPKVGTERDF